MYVSAAMNALVNQRQMGQVTGLQIYRFWMWKITHQSGVLDSGGLGFGGLESRSTDFGSGRALISLRV